MKASDMVAEIQESIDNVLYRRQSQQTLMMLAFIKAKLHKPTDWYFRPTMFNPIMVGHSCVFVFNVCNRN